MVYLIVSGSRTFQDRELLYETLDKVTARTNKKQLVLVHGGCPRGADYLASKWAWERRVIQKIYHAEWERHGKAAGPLRNREMVEKTIASGVTGAVVFWDGLSSGTGNFLEEARRVGIKVKLVRF